MSLHDRPADRKPHTDAVRLRREECFKYVIRIIIAKTDPGILDRDRHRGRRRNCRFDPQDARPIFDTAHRLDSIDDEIEHDLLHLNPVGQDRRQAWIEFGPRGDLASLQLLSRQRQHLRDCAVDVDRRPFRRGFFGQLPNPPQYRAGAPAIADDVLDRLSGLF